MEMMVTVRQRFPVTVNLTPKETCSRNFGVALRTLRQLQDHTPCLVIYEIRSAKWTDVGM
jgi:hypothetical protein